MVIQEDEGKGRGWWHRRMRDRKMKDREGMMVQGNEGSEME